MFYGIIWLNKDGNVSEAIINNGRYRVQETNCRNVSLKEIKEQIKDSLKKDVTQFHNKRIVLAFSGGTDSTLLLCLAKDLGIKNILPVTLAYEKSEDLYFAKRITKHLNINLKIIMLNKQDLMQSKRELSKMSDKFNCRRRWVTYILLKLMSKYSQVVIRGDGMDELGGSYPYHFDPTKILFSKHLPKILNIKQKNLIRNIFKYKEDLKKSQFYALKFSWENFLRNNLKGIEYLSSNCLKMNVMLPYLSKEVINTMNIIPIEQKLDYKVGKKCIRLILEEYLPKGLIYRKKVGLPAIFSSTN